MDMVLANDASCLDAVPTRCASRPFDFAQGERRVRVGVGGRRLLSCVFWGCGAKFWRMRDRCYG